MFPCPWLPHIAITHSDSPPVSVSVLAYLIAGRSCEEQLGLHRAFANDFCCASIASTPTLNHGLVSTAGPGPHARAQLDNTLLAYRAA